MSKYTVRTYKPADYEQWNAFLRSARNATFLFHRDFMEYHSDRFNDFSLLIFDAEKLIALLPANRENNTVFSHQGLSYGGLVYSESVRLQNVIEIMHSVLVFLSADAIETLQLKSIPAIYHKIPAQDTDYALFLADAKIVRRDTLSVIDLTRQNKRSQIRARGIKKGVQQNLEIREEHNFAEFWDKILVPNLQNKHQVSPVHTADEISLLYNRFPGNIRQFNVYHENELVGGATIFESDNVAHIQYISANETKTELGTLDFLIAFLTEKVFADKRYFDFGTSNEEQGRKLNSGLSYWKESFGAYTVCQDFYEVSTKHYVKLEAVLK